MEMNNLNMPPHDLRAERAVLGSLLLSSNKLLIKIKSIIKDSEYFYNPAHEIIYQAIIDLDNDNKSFDSQIVYYYLADRNLIENIGSASYLLDLQDEVSSISMCEEHAKRVEEKYIARKTLELMNEASGNLYKSTHKINENINNLTEKFLNLINSRNKSALRHCSEFGNKSLEEIKKAASGDLTDINKRYKKSGIPDVNNLITGFKDGALIIVAARPGMGKTSYAINTAVDLAYLYQEPVIIFSLEMDNQQVSDRGVSYLSGVSNRSARLGYLENGDLEKIIKATEKYNNLPIFLDDIDLENPEVLRSKALNLKTKKKKIGAVVIDYLQLMEIKGKENRNQEVSKITRMLKKLAKELECPVIALSQLSRKLEERKDKRPMLSDLRESGSVEQDADIVMFIYRDEYYNPDSPDKSIAELIVAKNREGATGMAQVMFEGATTSFRPLQRY